MEGKDYMPGALKHRYPDFTHVSLDVRGLWVNDPTAAGSTPGREMFECSNAFTSVDDNASPEVRSQMSTGQET